MTWLNRKIRDRSAMDQHLQPFSSSTIIAVHTEMYSIMMTNNSNKSDFNV